MHPRVAELAKELQPLLENPPAQPTAAHRKNFMALRDKVKDLAEHPEMDSFGETERWQLYLAATHEANRQETFFAQNGNKWAD